MDSLAESLSDISRLNVIYTVLLVASADSLTFSYLVLDTLFNLIMDFNATITFLMPDLDDQVGATTEANGPSSTTTSIALITTADPRPSLLLRMAKRLAMYSDNIISYLQNHIEHSATSIASCSVLIIVLSIICCFIISLMREEERKIKEQYRKLKTGSSQSFIGPLSAGPRSNSNFSQTSNSTSSASNCCSFNQFHSGGYQKMSGTSINRNSPQDHHGPNIAGCPSINGLPFVSSTPLPSTTSNPFSSSPSMQTSSRLMNKVRIIELRRETYFGLVRLLKPGCRTIVLLCDVQSKEKLLSKYYNCVYPYRKNKTLQFAFLLIEKNIGWYKDLLKFALNEKRQLKINPNNCIGTVLALNGFKKYFSVYHASHSRWNLEEPFLLLEETLLDNLPEWLERLFSGKVNRYYVECWPDRMR